HVYSNNALTQPTTFANYATFVGEFGPCATCGSISWTQNFISSYLTPWNMSWTSWTMDYQTSAPDNPPLITDWNYDTTSYHGAYVKSALASAALGCATAPGGAPTYTPTTVPAPSNCYMLSNFNTSAAYPSATCPSTFAFDSTDAKWFSFDWTTDGSGNPLTLACSQAY